MELSELYKLFIDMIFKHVMIWKYYLKNKIIDPNYDSGLLITSCGFYGNVEMLEIFFIKKNMILTLQYETMNLFV